MKQENKSEVARLRQRIQEEYEAAERALTAPAITAPHQFITKRMESIFDVHTELKALVGQDVATQIMVDAINAAGGTKESESLWSGNRQISLSIVPDRRDKSLSKKKKRKEPQPTSHMLFTLASLRLVKDALSFLETTCMSRSETLPKRVLAKEVVMELHNKLDTMLCQDDGETEVVLDYNEVHILNAALSIYLIELQLSKKHELLAPCAVLCEQFILLTERADTILRTEKKKRSSSEDEWGIPHPLIVFSDIMQEVCSFSR
jgi:hypothetical protein